MLLLTNLIVAPPRGERGLKPILRQIAPRIHGRSPSWGAWIETSQATAYISILSSRSPSWGAWIETWMLLKRKWENKVPSWGAWIETVASTVFCTPVKGRSPSWGAWIETAFPYPMLNTQQRRSPSWGAWIETFGAYLLNISKRVAPPRGERGLKPDTHLRMINKTLSLPLVGSVD